MLPLGPPGQAQWLTTVDKHGEGADDIEVRQVMLVVFVPLTSKEDQLTNPLTLMHPDVVNTKS